MTEVTTREILQELAEKPIGSEELAAEANNVAYLAAKGGRPKVSAELRGAIDRTCKKWLPQGRRTVSRAEAKAAEQVFYANQIDLEDAVQAAGGTRGSLR